MPDSDVTQDDSDIFDKDAEVTIRFELRVPVAEVLDPDDDADLSTDQIRAKLGEAIQGNAQRFVDAATGFTYDLPDVEVGEIS